MFCFGSIFFGCCYTPVCLSVYLSFLFLSSVYLSFLFYVLLSFVVFLRLCPFVRSLSFASFGPIFDIGNDSSLVYILAPELVAEDPDKVYKQK